MRIARADLRDTRVVAVLALHRQLALGASEPGAGHALDAAGLDRPDIHVFVGEVAGEPVAIGALRRLAATHGELKAMHVAAEHRGEGHGRVMLAHLVEHASGIGIERVSLETGYQPYFAAARALYEGHGFTRCGRFGDYPDHPDSLFLTMALRADTAPR